LSTPFFIFFRQLKNGDFQTPLTAGLEHTLVEIQRNFPYNGSMNSAMSALGKET